MRKNTTNWIRWGSVITLAGALLVTGLTTASSPRPIQVGLTVDEEPLDRGPASVNSFSHVVNKVGPSVVQVHTTARVPAAFKGGDVPFDHPWLRRFFDLPPGGFGQREMPRMPRQRGVGSGVIVTEDGYILTNSHVVEHAEEVRVTLQDGEEYKATVVGTDPKTDVAVLRIEADDLPQVTLTDSSQIEVGDLVLAIGNPFGIGQTVTMGMISAKGRGNMGLDYEDFIQTDAAINPGNSGGALVDAQGRLVGINTAIISRSGGNNGIGFAIPSNLARQIMEGLIRDGRVTRGYLGVLIQDLDRSLADALGLDDTEGALISEVQESTPAARAGLKSGDVILSFDGHDVKDSRQLKFRVAETLPSKKVPVTVWRDGDRRTLQVKLQELPDTPELARAAEESTDETSRLTGVVVGDIDQATRQSHNLPDDLKGALVTRVEPDSAAAEAGLRPGDVIQEIDREPVEHAREAVQLSRGKDKAKTLLRVWNNGGSRYIVVEDTDRG
jgi:serine protease Do